MASAERSNLDTIEVHSSAQEGLKSLNELMRTCSAGPRSANNSSTVLPSSSSIEAVSRKPSSPETMAVAPVPDLTPPDNDLNRSKRSACRARPGAGSIGTPWLGAAAGLSSARQRMRDRSEKGAHVVLSSSIVLFFSAFKRASRSWSASEPGVIVVLQYLARHGVRRYS